MNKSYFIIFFSIIFLIGSIAIFHAGYESDENEVQNSEEKAQEYLNEKQGKETKKEPQDKNDEKINDEKPEGTENNEEDFGEPYSPEKFEVHSDQIVNCGYSIKGIPSPKSIAFRPKSNEFWSTSLMNQNYGVVIFDFKKEKRKDLSLPGGGGTEIKFNKDGSYAYVSQMETGRIFKIDATERRIEKKLETESSWTKIVDLQKDKLFASNWVGNDISKLDIDSGDLENKISTVTTPRGIYLSGKRMYVAGFDNGEIEKHNLETGESETLIKTGGAMRDLIGSEDYIYASDMGKGKIYMINKNDQSVKKLTETDNNPNTIRLTPDEKILIVSNRGANNPEGYNQPGPEWGSILFFNSQTGEKLDALVGGNQPTGLDVSSDGKNMIFSNFLDGEIIFCNLPSYEAFKTKEGRANDYHEELIK